MPAWGRVWSPGLPPVNPSNALDGDGPRWLTPLTGTTLGPLMSEPDLFAVPLEDFVRARNALAARHRAAGRTSEAVEIQRLRKPTPAVWSINQIARRYPEKVRELADAVEALRRAHFKEAGELAQAVERHRAVLQDLVERATSILGTSGRGASPDVVRRISNTLSGAMADAGARADVLHGRLTEEHEAPGFEAFVGTKAKAASSPSVTSKERDAPRRVRADAKRQQGRARELERIAGNAQRAADASASAAQDARQRLGDLERRAAELRKAAEQAAQAARQARQDAERAAEKARARYLMR